MTREHEISHDLDVERNILEILKQYQKSGDGDPAFEASCEIGATEKRIQRLLHEYDKETLNPNDF